MFLHDPARHIPIKINMLNAHKTIQKHDSQVQVPSGSPLFSIVSSGFLNTALCLAGTSPAINLHDTFPLLKIALPFVFIDPFRICAAKHFPCLLQPIGYIPPTEAGANYQPQFAEKGRARS